ncbi:Prenyltransferase/squalene oxidase [Neofusicoccum parvum]|nr:Prenyltransferase/squalene oxidase [Neofusicoccum parvum]
MASFTSNIPLHCSICPRRPRFSDVSHLLTHIASKGHLSHYYKLQIRSASEEDARQQLDSYNTWYTEWGIEHLMSDRMSLKDRRRTRTRAANARARQAPNPPQDSLRRKAVNASTLDPRLAEQFVKDEPSPSPSPHFPDQPYPPPSFAAKQNVWPSPYSNTTGSFSNPGLVEDSDVFTEKSEPGSRAITPPMTASTAPSLNVDNESGEVNDPTAVSEASKLKGIYWPGMDIFDSATPEMKRKRNQKKDVSVVEQLESNSLDVAATELIWTPCGTLRKERPISGSVTDSSPVKLDVSPSRDFQDRIPLAALDPNNKLRSSSRNPRLPPRGQARGRRRSPKKPTAHDMILEDEMDQEMALDESRKRKRAFGVHKQDDSELFGRPTNMSMLTAEFNPSSQQSQPPAARHEQKNQKPLVQPQQHPLQLQHHLGQPLQSQQHDFLQTFDLQTINPFQSFYDPFGFSYQPTTSYFENSFPYPAQPFQAFQPQSDFTGTLSGPFVNNNSWLNTTPFQGEETDARAQISQAVNEGINQNTNRETKYDTNQEVIEEGHAVNEASHASQASDETYDDDQHTVTAPATPNY